MSDMLQKCNAAAREVDALTLPAREEYAKGKAEADAAFLAVTTGATDLTPEFIQAMIVHRTACRAALDKYLAALEALKQGG
jgi:hypothetical protein